MTRNLGKLSSLVCGASPALLSNIFEDLRDQTVSLNFNINLSYCTSGIFSHLNFTGNGETATYQHLYNVSSGMVTKCSLSFLYPGSNPQSVLPLTQKFTFNSVLFFTNSGIELWLRTFKHHFSIGRISCLEPQSGHSGYSSLHIQLF